MRTRARPSAIYNCGQARIGTFSIESRQKNRFDLRALHRVEFDWLALDQSDFDRLALVLSDISQRRCF